MMLDLNTINALGPSEKNGIVYEQGDHPQEKLRP